MATKILELESPKPIGTPATLALADLSPSPGNREVRLDEDLKALAKSIGEVGLIYPIVVKADLEAQSPGRYRIIAGERRWRAMKHLKLEAAPCLVVEDQEDAARAEVLGVVENHQRRNLTPLEEAAAVRGLLDAGYEPLAVARSLGRSRAWVARRACLTGLSEQWLGAIKNPQMRIGEWPPCHLEVIARFPENVQNTIFEQWARHWQYNVPSLRDLIDVTGRFLRELSAAPWKLEDEVLCAEAGACTLCSKRSSHAPDLFAGDYDTAERKSPPGDRCLDPACWSQKAQCFLKRRAEDLRREHPALVLLNNTEEEDGFVSEQLEDSFQCPVLAPIDVIPCRKSQDKAVPALVVNGAGLGRVRWVQPLGSASASSANGHANGRPDLPKGAPTYTVPERTPEEKKEPYDKRRRQLVIDAVQAKLRALAQASGPEETKAVEGGSALVAKGLLLKTLVLLRAMLSEQGWRSGLYQSLAMPEAFPWESLEGFKNHEVGGGETREAALAVCWELLALAVDKMASRLVLGMNDRTNTDHYAEAVAYCEMLGFDLGALQEQAAAAVPYAKSWRDQVQDAWAAPGSQEPAVCMGEEGSGS